jgi:hypothetical protein
VKGWYWLGRCPSEFFLGVLLKHLVCVEQKRIYLAHTVAQTAVHQSTSISMLSWEVDCVIAAAKHAEEEVAAAAGLGLLEALGVAESVGVGPVGLAASVVLCTIS